MLIKTVFDIQTKQAGYAVCDAEHRCGYVTYNITNAIKAAQCKDFDQVQSLINAWMLKYILLFFLFTSPAFATINEEQELAAEQSPICLIEEWLKCIKSLIKLHMVIKSGEFNSSILYKKHNQWLSFISLVDLLLNLLNVKPATKWLNLFSDSHLKN